MERTFSAGSPRLSPGTRLHGHELVERLGEGGFGEVWSARGLSDEAVALKIGRPQEPKALGTLQREVELYALLRPDSPPEPGSQARSAPIVALKRDLLLADPPAIVMELMAGGDLRAWMEKRWNRPLSLEKTLPVVRGALEALDFAHRRGVSHRDLSPENILLDEAEDRWKVADFGVGAARTAQEFSLLRSGVSTELSSGVAGKVHYMAPEVQRGGEGGPMADLYALGVLWAQLLLGSMDAGLPATWARRVPEEALPLLERCLEEDPADRWDSAGEALEALSLLEAKLGPRVAFSGAGASTPAKVPTPEGFRLAEESSIRLKGTSAPLVSPDAGKAAGFWGAGQNAVRFWDLESGDPFAENKTRLPRSLLALSPDGKRVACAFPFYGITIRDALSDEGLARLASTYFSPKVGTFSPDGKRFAAGYSTGAISEWDAQTGEKIKDWRAGSFDSSNPVNFLAYSPAGDQLIACFRGQDPTVSELQGAKWQVLSGHSAQVSCAAISPDGRHALTGARYGFIFWSDKSLKLWNLSRKGDEKLVRTMYGHSRSVTAVAFSPCGRRALSGGADRTVRLWNLENGAQLSAAIGSRRGSAQRVGFAPDGRSAWSLGEDGRFVRWRFD